MEYIIIRQKHPELAQRIEEMGKTAKFLAETKKTSGPQFEEFFIETAKIMDELIDLVGKQDILIRTLLEEKLA